MSVIADDEPPAVDVLEDACSDGRVWVHVVDEQPVGYVLLEWVDGCTHIEQVSVHASYAGQRIGAGLVDRVVREAASRGHVAVTLTTFAEVPWNGPYYERLGFRVLGETEWTPGLRAIRAEEIARGLDRWPRVCMRRDVG